MTDMGETRPERDEEAEPAVPSCPAGPIDLNLLSRYTFGNHELQIEVLQLFAAEAPKTLERLQSAKTDRMWREVTHTLKGSAKAVGAWRVGELAQHAEAILDANLRKTATSELTLAIEEACSFIRAMPANSQTRD